MMSISKAILDAKIAWMDDCMKGKFIPSQDNEGRDKNWQRNLYTKEEKKIISEEAQKCYMWSNEEYESVCDKIAKYGRIPDPVPIDGHCMFTAVMKQCKLNPNFKVEDMRHQVAYFLSKLPEQFYQYSIPYLEDQSFESYILNVWLGLSYGDELCLGVLGYMWNLKITIVSPDMLDVKIFHTDEEDPDIVLVHNGKDGLEGHYSAMSEYISFFFLTM